MGFSWQSALDESTTDATSFTNAILKRESVGQ